LRFPTERERAILNDLGLVLFAEDGVELAYLAAKNTESILCLNSFKQDGTIVVCIDAKGNPEIFSSDREGKKHRH
jgi:hypothetical protein